MDKSSMLIKKIRWDRIWIYFYPENYDPKTEVFICSMVGEKLFALKSCDEEKAYKINISNNKFLHLLKFHYLPKIYIL